MIEMLREREIRAEGRIEGFEEGRREGLTETRREIFNTIVSFMKSEGMSDKDIDEFRKFLQEESHS